MVPETQDKDASASPKTTTPALRMRARGSFVVLKLVRPKRSEGGIILPEEQMHQQRFAIVAAVGEGMITINGSRCPHDIKVGDLVLVRPNRGVPFIFGGQPFLWIDQSDLPVAFELEDGSAPDTTKDLIARSLTRASEVEIGAAQKAAGVEGDPD